MNNVIKDFEQDESAKTYKMMLERFSLTTLEEAILMFHIATHYGMEAKETVSLRRTDSDNANAALEFACRTMKNDEEIGAAIGIMQYSAQVERYKRNKQTYVFDKDFLSELFQTETNITVPYDIFDRMPFKSVYLDYSSNEEICSQLGIDGVLAQVEGVRSEEGGEDWVILMLVYRNGSCIFTITQVLPNMKDNEELDLDCLVNAINRKYITDEAVTSLKGVESKEFFGLVVQSLMYLCSYEPDIRESAASKQRYKTVKRTAKSKMQLPEREHSVGERYGEAFRKWTKGSLNQSHEGTGAGSKKRPHLRRAHWHRYWTGKRNSPERELIIRWVSECFCGLSEGETDKLDSVTHEVISCTRYTK